MEIDVLKGLFLEEDVLDVEPEEPKLDRALTFRFSPRSRGSVRLSLGLFYTKEEWGKKRKELLSKPFP